MRYVDQGVAVARFRFDTTERGYTLQNGTQVPDHTDWHNVLMWRRLAETVERYVHKGDKLYIEGRIRYSSRDDRKGQRQFVTEIWADSMEMLGSKPALTQQPQSTEPATNTSDAGTLPF
ncbi:MAG: single-stranded DNA-binding protein [Prevotella sp.]|nr:single-stranded DNA-binding protein [Prevotella sp.]